MDIASKVDITKGPWKGYRGEIRTEQKDHLRVLLEANGKIVRVPKDSIKNFSKIQAKIDMDKQKKEQEEKEEQKLLEKQRKKQEKIEEAIKKQGQSESQIQKQMQKHMMLEKQIQKLEQGQKRKLSLSLDDGVFNGSSSKELDYARESTGDNQEYMAAYGGGYGAEGIDLSSEEKKVYKEFSNINSYLLFPFEKKELLELAVELKKFLLKKQVAISQKEIGIMAASLLLLVAGKRGLYPEDVSKKCSPVRYDNISYLHCVLKDYFKDKDLERKLNMAFKFLSKEMNIPIQKSQAFQKRTISRPKKMLAAAQILKSKFTFADEELLNDIFSKPLGPKRLENISKASGIPVGEIVAASIKAGGVGRVGNFVQLPKVADNVTSRKYTMPKKQDPGKFKVSSTQIIKKNIKGHLDNKIEKTSGEAKKAFRFIKNNFDKDLSFINDQLNSMNISSPAKKSIKNNIKAIQQRMEEEIEQKMKKMKL